jgi:hypothetical protein
MAMRKRGIQKSLVNLIYTIIVIGVLALFISMFLQMLLGEASDTTCTASLVASAYKDTPIQCHVNDIVVYPDHIEKDGKIMKVFLESGSAVTRFDPTDENLKAAVKYVMAEEFKRCWENIGQGKGRILPANMIGYSNKKSFWSSMESYCLLCSDIIFHDSVNTKIIPGIFEYLQKTQIRETTYNGQKYHDFLQKDNPDNRFYFGSDLSDVSSIDKMKTMRMDTDEEYYLYAHIGQPSFFEGWAGKEAFYFLLLFPKEKVNQCALIVN